MHLRGNAYGKAANAHSGGSAAVRETMSCSVYTAIWMDHKNNVLEVGSRKRPVAQDHRVS